MIPCQNQESAPLLQKSAPLRKAFASRLPGVWIVGAALLIGASTSRAAEPNVKMRPLMIDGTWEVAGMYQITDKGWKFNCHESDQYERIRISRSAIQVFRTGQHKPTEEFGVKILRLADRGVGSLEFNDKLNGIANMTVLYRFEGNRLLLCVNQDLPQKPASFAAKGTQVFVLIPYQQDRLIASVQLPKPKPHNTFQNVGGKANPGGAPPPPKQADE